MPLTVHCSICGKAITGKDFAERMKLLRRHRKAEHPKAHKESVKKGLETKRKKGIIDKIKGKLKRKMDKAILDKGWKDAIKLYGADVEILYIPKHKYKGKIVNLFEIAIHVDKKPHDDLKALLGKHEGFSTYESGKALALRSGGVNQAKDPVNVFILRR